MSIELTDSYTTHEDMEKFAITILGQLGHNNLRIAEGNRSTAPRGPIPDLVNDKIAVEVGNLSYRYHGSGGRIDILLTQYEKVFWIPYPDLVRVGNVVIPYFRIIAFEKQLESLGNSTKGLYEMIAERDRQIVELKKQAEIQVADFITKLTRYIKDTFGSQFLKDHPIS